MTGTSLPPSRDVSVGTMLKKKTGRTRSGRRGGRTRDRHGESRIETRNLGLFRDKMIWTRNWRLGLYHSVSTDKSGRE